VRLRPAQVEITETQARLFLPRLISSSIGNGGVLALFRICSFAATNSTSPVANSGLAFWRFEDLAFHGDDKFAARLLGFGVRRGLRLFVEDHLNDAGAVANIQKEQIAEIAGAARPSPSR